MINIIGNINAKGFMGGGKTILTRNIDIVEAGGYKDVLNSGTVLNSATTGRWFLNKNNLSRIRQYGYITKIKLYIGYLTIGPISIYFQVWRKNGSNYDLVGEENITSKVTGGLINTIQLSIPILSQEGDYIGMGAIGGVEIMSLYATNVTTANSVVWINGDKPGTTGVNFDAGTKSNYVFPCKVYMQSPVVVFIGNSITAGHTLHYSFIENSFTTNTANTIEYQLYNFNSRFIYQNMGIGGYISEWNKNRFTADVINLKPVIAIIENGVNDIALGTVLEETFLSNMSTMLNSCINNNIIPIVCKIMPWTNGTNEQMQTRDLWNNSLDTLVATYPTAIIVDFDSAVGQFRAGGDPDNLWNIKTSYNQDGVHFNTLGYTEIANTLYKEISKKYIIKL
jgi:lysophospholipase L1-like esterase